MSNKVIKSVSFNPVMNENDALILKTVKRRNFSGYVKKLILEDIKTQKEGKAEIEATEGQTKASKPSESQKEMTAAEKLAKLKKSGQQPAPKTFINQQKN